LNLPRVLIVTCLLGLLLAGSPVSTQASDPLTITSTTPSVIYNDLDTTLTLKGTGFSAVTSVTLDVTDLQDVVIVDDETLTALLPWGMTPGTYTLSVSTGTETASLASAVTVNLGIGQWISDGPFGGRVSQILQNPLKPDTIYTTVTDVGIFRSQDHGMTWQFIFYSAAPIGNLAMDAVDPDLLYATKAGQGLYRSTDGGDTWKPILIPGISVYTIRAFTHPTQTKMVFATLLFSGQASECANACGIYRSSDAGDTWQRISADIPSSKRITTIGFGANGSYLYTGTQDGLVYRSTDNGDHWTSTAVNWNGAEPAIPHVSKLVVQPETTTLYWVSSGEGFGGPLYRCTEVNSNGVISLSCNPVDLDGTPNVDSALDIQFNPTHPQDILVASRKPARSTDNGATWFFYETTSSPFQSSAVAYDRSQASTIFAADDRGFYANDQADSYSAEWVKQITGMTGLVPLWLVASPSQPQSVYVNTGSGLFHSADGGLSWTQIPNFTLVTPLAVDPTDDSHLILFTWHNTVEISQDGGESWIESTSLTIPGAFAGFSFFANFIKPIPGAANQYLVGGYFQDPANSDNNAAPGGGIYRLTVTGTTVSWTNLYADPVLGRITVVVFDPSDPDNIYCGSYTKDSNQYPAHAALVYSTNGGQSWTVLSPPPGSEVYNEVGVGTLTIRPSSDVLVAASGGAIFSINPGTNDWERYGNSPATVGPINQLFYTPALGASPETLYAATYAQGLFQSTNGAASWSYTSSKLIGADVTVMDYVAMNDTQGILYTGVAGGALASGATSQSISVQAGETRLIDGGVYRLTRLFTHGIYLPLVKK